MVNLIRWCQKQFKCFFLIKYWIEINIILINKYSKCKSLETDFHIYIWRCSYLSYTSSMEEKILVVKNQQSISSVQIISLAFTYKFTYRIIILTNPNTSIYFSFNIGAEFVFKKCFKKSYIVMQYISTIYPQAFTQLTATN